jgi:hypothetical protein
MDRVMEYPLTLALGRLTMARRRCEVWKHSASEAGFALVRGIDAAREMARRTFPPHPGHLGTALERAATLGEPYHRRFSGGRNWPRRPHRAVVVRPGEAVLALRVFVARIAPASAAFLGHRVGCITVQEAAIALVLV